MSDPGVEALRRTLPHALAVADPGGSEPLDWSGSEYVDRMAVDLIASWSPADRLAIAGITEDRLAVAIHESGVAGCRVECPFPKGAHPSGADHDYGVLLLAALDPTP